jgi:hypothetical protein
MHLKLDVCGRTSCIIREMSSAAQNIEEGHMRHAAHEFDMPAVHDPIAPPVFTSIQQTLDLSVPQR